ncbi:MAG: GAF domain-containing protein [Cyanobacteriota bacterium]|nr:GAF domain-containing protein [Cyanobacteriota bacterium]
MSLIHSPVRSAQIARDRDTLLGRATQRILQSLSFTNILTATVSEVRSFLRSDRVKIYRFHADKSGEIVAESLIPERLPAFLGLNFPLEDIPESVRHLFVTTKMRSMVDVARGRIAYSYLIDPTTGKPTSPEIRDRAADPCHLEYLAAMGVQSSLTVPIFHQKQLWGFLLCHDVRSRTFNESELQAVQSVVDLLCVAIAQATLLTSAREKANREATLNRISRLLHSQSTPKLQSALTEAVTALQGAGGRLYLSDETENAFYIQGTQLQTPEIAPGKCIEQQSAWTEYFRSSSRKVWAISDLYRDRELHDLQPAFNSTEIRGLLVVSLYHRNTFFGYLSIFRNHSDIETLWAGQRDRSNPQVQPRRSFEVWKEIQSDRVSPWTEEEKRLATEIGRQFASAIAQSRTYQQLQTLNATLEQRIQERTAQWKQTAQQQRVLFEVVTKIRESLDLNEIFPRTTQEIRALLQVERATIYRFRPDWDGEFLSDFESCAPQWQGVGSFAQQTIWNDTYLQETQGGHYSNNEICAIDNVHCAGLAPRYLKSLKTSQIEALVTVPIFVRQQLWGLLAVYQHSAPRQWERSEIQFLTQIATQLGVALQQADLLTQRQQQAQQLAETLKDLQKTQSQLIQTEKMSSLGQLVAGIAHEINNPVNFIYGNLTYACEYTEELIELVQLYQNCSQPSGKLLERLDEIDLDFLCADLPKILHSMNVGAERIRQIVLSLKNFSRLDEAEKKPVDIHDGIDSTLLILQHRLKGRGDNPTIEVDKDYGDLPLVECHAGQLNQVFMNVLSNAIDALEQEIHQRHSQSCPPFVPKITIGTAVVSSPLHSTTRSREQQYSSKFVEIRIADNGPGIPEAVREQLFDPFFTTKPVGKGTGLGLSISYHIVTEKHGGYFSFVSPRRGGTEFAIALPLAPSQIVETP